ncbi:MAG: tRNA (5-methylaminomethyl-2-thiouridine)(34)-methyltransferase MnmD [Rhodobacter sp.]|nr:tRNA (5-methylaminomethyl-2-thiouridine)(34)-methyltransferase MnmD [Rhodobacter sp.]
MTESQQADLIWTADTPDAVPVSARFGDPYYSLEGGVAESRHVFLAGNDLPERFRPGFRIAELGFGTGLNLLTAYLSWRRTRLPGCLTYSGFEAFPLAYDDMNRALMAFPEVYSTARPLLDASRAGETRFSAPGLEAEIVLGDARRTLPLWHGGADAWFLDGFAPARNPELWGPELMMEVARHTRAGGTVATYSSAGNVRRALQLAGFEVERTQGYGGKRHMTKGTIR